jgi:clathrin heavy chain
LESDHYVCVRQKINEDDKPQVIIIDLKNDNEIIKRPINADSAIMHWNKQVIALKAQSRTIQIFDLGAKQKLKSAMMNEDIVFWKWYSESSLGLVTDTSVHHWNVFDPTQSSPVKVFERNAQLAVSLDALRIPPRLIR